MSSTLVSNPHPLKINPKLVKTFIATLVSTKPFQTITATLVKAIYILSKPLEQHKSAINNLSKLLQQPKSAIHNFSKPLQQP